MIEPIDIAAMIRRDVGRMPYPNDSEEKIERYNRHVEEWIIEFGQNLEGAIKYLKNKKQTQ